MGATIGKFKLSDVENSVWSMSAKEYLQNAIPVVRERYVFKSGAQQPLPTSYHPELDQSPPLDEDEHRLYMSYIGILQWTVELGRIDVTHSVSKMATYLACPRKGHLEKVLQIFSYLEHHLNSRLVFDPVLRDWNDKLWVNEDWSEFYPDAAEVIPPNAPEPRGKAVQLNVFCDAAHATDLVTRRSVSGIIIFLNGAPIRCFSKRQNTIESSVFGAEFVALKIATEMIEEVRYKLRMMGVPLDGPANCFCDNQSVVTNASEPASTLKKKHNSVAYHKVREATAAGTLRITHEPGKMNVADMLTKTLSASKLKACASSCLY